MKKTLPIIAVVAASLTIGASIAVANSRDSLIPTLGTPTTVPGQLVFDWNSVKNEDSSGAPYYCSFDLTATTKSGYGVVTAEDCSVGSAYYEGTVEFKKQIDDKKYIFNSVGDHSGDAYFFIEIWLTGFYTFSSVTIAGLFNGGYSTEYKTYSLSNPGTQSTKVVEVDDGDAVLTISSGAMDNNYSSVALESITINYTCLA